MKFVFCVAVSCALVCVDFLFCPVPVIPTVAVDLMAAVFIYFLTVMPSVRKALLLISAASVICLKAISLCFMLPPAYSCAAISIASSLLAIFKVKEFNLVSTGPFMRYASCVTWLCCLAFFMLVSVLLLIADMFSPVIRDVVSVVASVALIALVGNMARFNGKGDSIVGSKPHLNNFKVVSISDFAYQQFREQGGENSAMSRLFSKLEAKMNSEKYYLDEELNLDALSTLMLTNKSYLSKTINVCSSRNFRQYINWYRIKYAIGLLSDGTPRKMDDVASLSGFHNVVSFNMAFKLNMGKTPSEWLEEYKLSKLK